MQRKKTEKQIKTQENARGETGRGRGDAERNTAKKTRNFRIQKTIHVYLHYDRISYCTRKCLIEIDPRNARAKPWGYMGFIKAC